MSALILLTLVAIITWWIVLYRESLWIKPQAKREFVPKVHTTKLPMPIR